MDMSDMLFGLEYGDNEAHECGDNTFEGTTRTVLVELAEKQEDYIAEQLMRLGWTPPENSRWSKIEKN